MKSKIIFAGAIVAIISVLLSCEVFAQSPEVPGITVVSTNSPNVVKVIYAYQTSYPLDIRFSNFDGLLFKENLAGKTFENGFMKKYSLEKMNGEPIWVEIESHEYLAIFKMTKLKNKKWSVELQELKNNQPALASK